MVLVLILAFFSPSLQGEPGRPDALFNQPAAKKWRWCHTVEETLKPHCHNTPTEPSRKCCELCVWTKACGDKCIDILKPCAKAKGCACNTLELPRVPANQVPQLKCCQTCWKGKPCGDECIPKGKLCASATGCACAPGQTDPTKQ